MNELNQTQLFERVIESNVPNGNPRVQKIVARVWSAISSARSMNWISNRTNSGQVSTG